MIFPYWQPDQILEIYKWGKSKWSFLNSCIFQTLEVMICIIAMVWVTIILKVSFITLYMLKDLLQLKTEFYQYPQVNIKHR